jgi:hypothetical protein
LIESITAGFNSERLFAIRPGSLALIPIGLVGCVPLFWISLEASFYSSRAACASTVSYLNFCAACTTFCKASVKIVLPIKETLTAKVGGATNKGGTVRIPVGGATVMTEFCFDNLAIDAEAFKVFLSKPTPLAYKSFDYWSFWYSNCACW